MRIQPAHLLILLLMAVALPLSACGKKGNPQPPAKAESEAQDKKEETE